MNSARVIAMKNELKPGASPEARALGVAVRYHRAEPSLIFCGSDEGTDHAAIVVAVTVIQHVQPEVIACCIRAAPQIAEVLHQHERLVVDRA